MWSPGRVPAKEVAVKRLAVAGLGLLLACQAGVQAADPGGDPPTGPGGGCEGRTATPGVTNGSIDVAGVPRTYVLVLPAATPSTPLPIYFVFHGLGGSGAQYRSWMRFEREAQGDAIFVYPDGLPDGQGQTGWPDTGGRDVAFFDALLARLQATACADPRRVFVTGFSYGGYMSNTLGCRRAGVVRGIAPLSGGLPWAGSCNGQAAAAWIAHGIGDATVAFSQGEQARDHWLAANRCGTATRSVDPPPCQAYQGCAAGQPVVWCAFDGGHEVPPWVYAGVMEFFRSLP
jgi:poly(3-hydroxybutyrate) depolymerase